jgi:sodium-dependent dicarboxylate transporter 2/3/5
MRTSTVQAPIQPGSKLEVPGIVAALLATFVILLLPTPQGLPVEGHRLAAVFVGVLILWSTEALPMAVTSLVALAVQPMLWLTKVQPPTPAPISASGILGGAFKNFMSAPFFFVLVMFAIAFAWIKTGLARRFALWMISKAGTDSKRVLYVFMFGTGLISMVVSDVPCAAIFMAIALGIFERLGLRPGKSQFGRAVMIGIPIASLIGGVGTPAGSSINILGLTTIVSEGGARIPFLHWMAIGVPMVLVLLPVAAWILLKFFPPEIDNIGSIAEIERERKQLGSISGNEIKVLIIMGLMVCFWVAGTWYSHFDPTLVAVCGAILMFLPGIKLFTWQEVQASTDWATLMMIGGVTTLGAASGQTGLANWLATSALYGISEWGIVWVIVAISAFTVVIHLMLPIAPVINAVMIPPIMALGVAAGVNPALYALPVVFTASCAFLLPMDAVPLVTFSKGYYKMFDMFLPGLIISIIWVILMTVLMLSVGPWIGLL